jgi:hypothetical protein
MKHLKSLFLIALTALTTTAWGATCIVNIYSVERGAPLSNGSTYTGPLYADGAMMLTGEKMLVVFAELDTVGKTSKQKKELLNKTPEALFEIDKMGDVSLTIEGESIVLQYDVVPFTLNETATFGVEDTLGANFFSGYLWRAQAKPMFDLTSSCIVAYFVRIDSRAYDTDLDVFEIRNACRMWRASKIAAFDPTSFSPGGYFAEITLDHNAGAGFTYIENPMPTIATILPQSLVVGDKTLTGDELDAYLAPAVEALASNEGGFILSGSSNDILTYTLQTKASLDGEWEDFDEFLADNSEKLSEDEKKTLESSSEKCYTCLRVKKSTQIKIPRLPNETQRFYRLKAE